MIDDSRGLGPRRPPRSTATDDPVLARRALFARAAVAGKRVGYLLLLVAMIAFAAGFKAGFGGAVTAVVVACMIGSTLTLAPGIVINYAVRAAEREDRQRGRPE